MSASPAAAPHVLIVRRRYLGDIVLLSTTLRNLRHHWPKARLVLLCDQAYAGAAALHWDLDESIYFPRRALQWPPFLARLRRARFSHVVDYDNRDKTALFTRVTGAPSRLVLHRDHPRFPLRHAWVYTQKVPMTRAWHDSHHISDIYHALIEPLGVPQQIQQPRFRLKTDDVTEMERLVRGSPGPKVVVHPGTRSRFRLWPTERFASVCDRLQDELGAQVFLIGGAAEVPVINEVREKAKTHLVHLDRPLSVPQLAALFAQFDVLLGHDSGPMHVAAGVGTPVVALYGSQNATIWRPTGSGHRLLQTELPCSCFPAGTLPSTCDPNDAYRTYCVRKLEAETVFSAIADVLRSPRVSNTSTAG
jgi:heptosyltransferase III